MQWFQTSSNGAARSEGGLQPSCRFEGRRLQIRELARGESELPTRSEADGQTVLLASEKSSAAALPAIARVRGAVYFMLSSFRFTPHSQDRYQLAVSQEEE